MPSFYDVLLYFLSDRVPQDRLWKVAQYGIRLYSMQLPQAAKSQKLTCEEFASKFNYARLLLRVGDVIEDVSDTSDSFIEAKNRTVSPTVLLSVLEPASNAFSDAFDFLCLVFDCLNLPDHSTWADYWSSLIGLVGNIMDGVRAIKTILRSHSKLVSASNEEFQRKIRFKLFIRGYIYFIKALADTILSLSSVIPKIEDMRLLVALSGFLGGASGLFLSYYSLQKQERAKED